MKTRVKVVAQVENFVKAQAPVPRKRLTRAIKSLAKDQGDYRTFEGRLAGYSRLRVGGYRIIFAERSQTGERIIDCVFAERRPIVYELYEKILSQQASS